MTEDLARLDSVLTERVAVPLKLLLEDYTGIAGAHGTAASEPNCELNYRLMATSWIGPWGSVAPWMMPPSTITVGEERTKVVLRLPQSRVRHFLSDASLYVKKVHGDNIRISSATLRLGPNKVLQSLDSQFACDVALVYKHDGLIAVTTEAESSVMLLCPLFFEAPLRVLPLFIPNTELPEIEYELTSSKIESVSFLTQFISSPGEADIPVSGSADQDVPAQSTVIIQHLRCFETFSATGDTDITIPISSKDEKLARALYIRVTERDIPDAILSLDLIGPPPRSKSIFGQTLPGSVCRMYFKSQFSKRSPDQLPYYTIPFALTPGANTADYGAVLHPGTELHLHMRPDLGTVSVDVCVETSNRVVWDRNPKKT